MNIFFDLFPRFRTFSSLPLNEKIFCQDCQVLLLPGEHEAHSSHRSTSITPAQLTRPSVLLRPLDNKKSNAQYLFTDRSSHFLLDILAALGYRRVLCVGTPRWERSCLNRYSACLKGSAHQNQRGDLNICCPLLCSQFPDCGYIVDYVLKIEFSMRTF